MARMTAGMAWMLSASLGALLIPSAHARGTDADRSKKALSTAQITPATDNAVGSANAEEMTVIGHHRMVAGAAANYNKKMANLGPLGTRRTLDTPMSIMTVPHDVIVNQQARNINDLMQYIPSVQLETRADPGTSRPQSRGFEADVISNSRIDGLNAFTVTPYAAEQFDNVQVLNGLAGALYGPQNPAGTFEYGLKRPTDERINRLEVGVDSVGTLMENVDASGRAGKHGWFGYRINLLHGDGTSYVQDSWVRRNMVSADFDIHFDRDTVLELDASHYTFDERGMPAGATSRAITCPRPLTWASPIWGRTMRATIPRTTSSSPSSGTASMMTGALLLAGCIRIPGGRCLNQPIR